jgi:hypothetical protein
MIAPRVAAPAIGSKPTHVVIEVRQSPSPSAPLTDRLTAGAQVILIEAADGWSWSAAMARRSTMWRRTRSSPCTDAVGALPAWITGSGDPK